MAGGSDGGTPMADASPGDSAVADSATDAPPAAKRFFVTSSTYNGDLKTAGAAADGLTGGDNLCKTAAMSASLGGTWRAWLSGDSVNAIDRINDVGPWHLVGGAVVFTNKDNLKTVPLTDINYDEKGQQIATGAAWTGTLTGGMAKTGSTCATFSTSDMNAFTNAGLFPGTSNWTSTAIGSPCSGAGHLYCIEQ